MTHLTEEEAMTKVTGDIMTHLTEEEAMTKVTVPTTYLTIVTVPTSMTRGTMTHLTEEEAMTKVTVPTTYLTIVTVPTSMTRGTMTHFTEEEAMTKVTGDSLTHLTENHKGSQEDAESSFPLTKFQKRVLQLLLDIRKTVSDTSTCGGKPADTACTLTIKRNNSLEEVQNLEDELVNPSYFMEVCNQDNARHKCHGNPFIESWPGMADGHPHSSRVVSAVLDHGMGR
ncbi:hypothetical protein O3P69_018347 [Scylla paramamosain]|uniref:Uncharacterized protein n=1 Tax=Scylla paramamosain TaxID=85552 RepID=A0AAW0SDU8_SCYPA